MSWQDIVITIIMVVFSLALIPQVVAGFKNKRGDIVYATSVPNFLGVYIVGIAYFTLKLFLSTFFCFITGTLWLILFFQRLKYNKNLSTPPNLTDKQLN